MRKHTKLALASLTATLLMGLAVANAAANVLSVSNQQFRVVWAELVFQTNRGETTVAKCPVTLEGSFHSATISKVEKALVGHISRATTGRCITGHATVLQESLPWHVVYNGFSGILPRISTITLLLTGAAFRIEPGLNFFCLSRTSPENPAKGIVHLNTSGVVTGLQADRSVSIPTTSAGGFGCPAESGQFEGEGTVTLLGNTQSITVTLI